MLINKSGGPDWNSVSSGAGKGEEGHHLAGQDPGEMYLWIGE